jgi:hypothetical protein
MKFEIEQKKLFLGQQFRNVGKKFGKVQKSSVKVWKVLKKFGNLGNCLFRTFRKLQKMMLNSNLEIAKTRSNLKTDSKVWLKVRNAGP